MVKFPLEKEKDKEIRSRTIKLTIEDRIRLKVVIIGKKNFFSESRSTKFEHFS